MLSIHLFIVYGSVLYWYLMVKPWLTYFENLQDELGTEYLVRPVGRAEDEEDASDFEPEENGDDEDVEDEDEGDAAGGKVEAPPKRKRSDKDDSDDDDDDGGEDDERPSKRQGLEYRPLTNRSFALS